MTELTDDDAIGALVPPRSGWRPENKVAVLSVLMATRRRRARVRHPGHHRRRRIRPGGGSSWSWRSDSGSPNAPSSISSSAERRSGSRFPRFRRRSRSSSSRRDRRSALGSSGSAIVLLFLRKAPAYKLLFNLALFTLELVLSYIVLRSTLDLIGTDIDDIVVATIFAITVSSLLGSVLVSVAIAMFEGDMLKRITSEFRLAWWFYIVNPTLAGMVLGACADRSRTHAARGRSRRGDVVPDPALRRREPATA